MIDCQLRTSGVNADWVLARLAAVPREDYVPAGARGIAYIDRAIPIGNGRALAAPLFHGMMLQEAAPTSEDRALLVDGGSGYLADLVRPLVGSLEIIAPDEALAASRDREFSLLLIDGAIEELPDTLVVRLAEGARVVAGLVAGGVTRLAAGRKSAGGVALLPLAELGVPLLPEFAKVKAWSF